MADTRSAADVRAAVERYVERFNAADKDAWLELFAADATLEDPVGTPVRHGVGSIGEFWDFAQSLATSVRLELTGAIRTSGGEAAFPLRIVSDLDGTKMAVDVIETQAYDADGRITAMRAYWDMAEMAPYEG